MNKRAVRHPSLFFVFTCSLCVLLLLNLSISRSYAREEEKTEELVITNWLLLGPFINPLPVLYEEHDKKRFIEGLINFLQIDQSALIPKADSPLRWHDKTLSHWREIQTAENGVTLIGDGTHPTIAYLGTYIDVKRWTRAKISLQTPYAFHLCVDGRICITKNAADNNEENKNSNEAKKLSTDIGLETGKHLILVKSVHDPDSSAEWTIKATISFEEKYGSPPPSLNLSPTQNMNLEKLLDAPAVTEISISPDGNLGTVTINKALPPGDDSESWLEMYDLQENRLIQTFSGGSSLAQIKWAPAGKKFSYTTRDKSGETLWVVDLEKGTAFPLLPDAQDLESYTWAPDGSYIIYSVSEKGQDDRAGVRRFQSLEDKKPWWRNKTYLYKVSLENGVRQRITAGEFSTTLQGIGPKSRKILYSRDIIDYSERPFLKTELYSLDTVTLENRMLWEGRWFNQAQWNPEGDKILILGGPSAFGKVGINVSNDLIPNEFDIQAYLFDPETGQAESISTDFDPSIQNAFWSRTEDAIYFLAVDHSYIRLFRYDLDNKNYLYIPCGMDIIERFDLARDKQMAAFTGSSTDTPPKAFVLNLKTRKYQLLRDPAQEEFADVKFGKVERWTFKNQKGHLIDGRIYYPPDFNPKQKYPCIVNYYGGTTPITREFGGRYPKNLWAAQGYVVYVVQPSGAVGYGQEFSALHVNDWGSIVADEIIYGVKEFLTTHPFVDARRVGCIGASYGGFITMLIQTRTNMFSTAVSHAGISSISSYWGEGYYGYEYSAYAAANSYPWNRKDIFINQSALFNADKITTPLLLLHGSEDTNVPPGESTQLFTALKILGREVEYIQILDQNHHIMTYNKRKIWTRTIMAWFDRWLKNQPEWWYYLYPNR
jgi:dipeptidyl aminopeptidase/acylaminoacyl peptidase